MSAVGTTTVEFKRIRQHMLDVCFDMIGTDAMRKARTRAEAKRKKDDATRETTTTTAAAKRAKTQKRQSGRTIGGRSVTDEELRQERQAQAEAREAIPGYDATEDAAVRKANLEYLEWRQEVLRKDKTSSSSNAAAATSATTKKKKKQTSILDSLRTEDASTEDTSEVATSSNDLGSLLAASFA